MSEKTIPLVTQKGTIKVAYQEHTDTVIIYDTTPGYASPLMVLSVESTFRLIEQLANAIPEAYK